MIQVTERFGSNVKVNCWEKLSHVAELGLALLE